jgi:arsenite oxidase small subunit
MNLKIETSNMWHEHFPVNWIDDDLITRREFTKSLGLVSFATFVATMAVAAISSMRRGRAKNHPVVNVGNLSNLSVGHSKLFFYPTPDSPCLLIRLSETEIAAYEQKCTHLGCPVHYDHDSSQLICPCHVGLFSAADGSVLAGPPQRALPQVELEVRGDEIWATGAVA